MFQHQGIWLPDGEKHFSSWMDSNGEIVDGRGTYQIKKWRACFPWIKNWRRAIDVGAHVGFWTIQMIEQKFSDIEAFEPVAEFRDCWWRNCTADIGMLRPGVILHEEALGAISGRVLMQIPGLNGGIDSGGTHVGRLAATNDEDPAVAEMRTLDSYDFEYVDFVKIDCEGYEAEVVKGAIETLKRWRPCVIVEQKPHKLGPNFGIEGTPAVDILRDLGAHMRTAISGDYIFSWD